MSRPRRKRRKLVFLVTVPPPAGLRSMAGLVGEAYQEAFRHNDKLWAEQRRLYAMRLISGREVPRCCAPVVSPMEGPDDQVCGITDPEMLAIDHIHNDGKKDRERYKAAKTWINAILTGEVDRRRLQILCHNHNNKKAIQNMRDGSHTGRPDKITDEQIRSVSGLSAGEAAAFLGVSKQTIYHRRRILLDIPVETVVD